jgi:hypothetical protein
MRLWRHKPYLAAAGSLNHTACALDVLLLAVDCRFGGFAGSGFACL